MKARTISHPYASIIEFTVPTIPVAQPRQRHRVATAGTKVFAQNYTPKKHRVNAFKEEVRHAFRQAHSGPPLDGPLMLEVVFVMPRPKTMRWKMREMPRMPYTSSKNDWDNLGKSFCDALNKVAWNDDGQLWFVSVRRMIADGWEQPHVEVRIQSVS